MCSYLYLPTLSLIVHISSAVNIIDINVTNNMYGDDVICPQSAPCKVICDENNADKSGVCELSNIYCPDSYDCDIECGPGLHACRDATVHCSHNQNCNINCVGFDSSNMEQAIRSRLQCDALNVLWPTAEGAQGSISCDGPFESLCSNIIFPEPPATDPMVFNCDGISKCEGSTIYCPSQSNCTIICNNDKACYNMIVVWPLNKNVTANLICNDSYVDPCLNITQYYPTTAIPTTFNPTKYPTNEPTIEPTTQPTTQPTLDPTTLIPTTSDPTTSDPTTANPTTTNPTTFVPTVSPTIAKEGKSVTEYVTYAYDTESGNYTKTNDNDTLMLWMIILAVAVICLVIVCIILIIILVICRQRKNNSVKQVNVEITSVKSVSSDEIANSPGSTDNLLMTNTTSTTNINTIKLSEENEENEENEYEDDELRVWLNNIDSDLMLYYDLFIQNGFAHKMQMIMKLNDDDLKTIGVDKLAHRKCILEQIEIEAAELEGNYDDTEQLYSEHMDTETTKGQDSDHDGNTFTLSDQMYGKGTTKTTTGHM